MQETPVSPAEIKRNGATSRRYSVKDFRALFEQGITVDDIAVRLFSMPAETPARDAAQLCVRQGFDTLGVAHDGVVSRFAFVEGLADGALGDYSQPFAADDLVAHGTPLIAILPLLAQKPRLYVLRGNSVDLIVTRADLDKPPLRVLVFGLISLIEMTMREVLCAIHPNEGWKSLVGDRIEGATLLQAERQRRGEDLGLIDCLQFGDTVAALLKSDGVVSFLLESEVAASKKRLAKYMGRLEGLRNSIAHSNPLNVSSWVTILPDIIAAEQLQLALELLIESSSG